MNETPAMARPPMAVSRPASSAHGQRILFLQGPHGPFFGDLAAHLAARGAEVFHVSFNHGDVVDWRGSRGQAPGPSRPWLGARKSFADWLAALVAADRITGIALYGDTRYFHARARDVADRAGIPLHCFEEGYLRPRWVTYERGGVNGGSPMMRMSLARMRDHLLTQPPRSSRRGDLPPAAPDGWGAAAAHMRCGLRYHFDLVFRNRDHPARRPERRRAPLRELAAYLRRAAALPGLALRRRLRMRRIDRPGARYHLALLQLGADASLRAHGPYPAAADFLRAVTAGFASGARDDEFLVFKTHPFEDGAEKLEQVARRAAAIHGLGDRVILIDGGPLGPLLDRARSAVTVNSTAVQQALWRGVPVLALGRAIYVKPGLAARRPLAEFFRAPDRIDPAKSLIFRRYLLDASQFEGDFYTRRGRARAIPDIAAAMTSAASQDAPPPAAGSTAKSPEAPEIHAA